MQKKLTINAQHNKVRELVGGQKFKCSICPLLWPLKYLHTIYQFKFSFHKYRNLSRRYGSKAQVQKYSLHTDNKQKQRQQPNIWITQRPFFD